MIIFTQKLSLKLNYFSFFHNKRTLFDIFMNDNSNDDISVDMVETYLETRDLDSYELAELLNEAELLEEDFSL